MQILLLIKFKSYQIVFITIHSFTCDLNLKLSLQQQSNLLSLLSYYFMGGFTSRTQADLKFYLQRDYDISKYPSIINKKNKIKAIVHQIVTDSTQQAHKIRSDVNMYNHIKCQSICKVLEYIPLQSQKLCSQQEYHYIVQQDLQKYNLKQEFLARKYYKQRFSDHQMISILKTFLCGLNVYHQKFQRKFNHSIDFDSITIDQDNSNHMRFKDPLLKSEHLTLSKFQFHNNEKENDNQVQQTKSNYQHKFHIRWAPQKNQMKKTKFNENKLDLNQMLSDVYTIGILVLEIHRMEIFNIKQSRQAINKQLNSISNREIKKALQILTSQDSQKRGQAFEVLKVSPFEQYCLQTNFINGKPKNYQDELIQNKKQNYNAKMNEEVKSSFSFGTSPLESLSTNIKVESFGLNLNHQGQRGISNQNNQLQSLDKNKTGTISTMSTDRSLTQNAAYTGTSLGNYFQNQIHPLVSKQSSFQKPIVRFNTGSSTDNLKNYVPVYSSSSQNLQNTSILNQNSNYLISNHSATILNKQTQSRSNSFLSNNQQKKPSLLKQYSPYKYQQDISPLSVKSQNISNPRDNKYTTNNFQHSPIQLQQRQRVQAEFNRILKQNQTKPRQQSIKNIKRGINNLPPIGMYRPMDSPISALQTNQINSFTLKQNEFKSQMQPIVRSQMPIYRPNKEVQQILKRLGIGQLLYGKGQNNINQIDQQNKQIQNRQKLNAKAENSEREEKQVFIHKTNYNINNKNKTSAQTQQRRELVKQKKLQQIEQKQSYEIQDRQTTPIRPVNKNKYNSTIVQVGDQDSQYSSSGARNLQNGVQEIDLTNHQYVVQEYQTGSRYQGYKLNGQRDGQGKFIYSDGGYYEGQWKDNKMDGWGKLFYDGGKLAYQGNWSQDQFHGFGKVYNDNPVGLQCGFDFTNFDLLDDYWEYYEGMLVKDTKQGRGKIKLTNSQIFQGDFHNDRIQGFGKFFMKQGSMIEGIWRDSKLIKIISS